MPRITSDAKLTMMTAAMCTAVTILIAAIPWAAKVQADISVMKAAQQSFVGMHQRRDTQLDEIQKELKGLQRQIDRGFKENGSDSIK